MIGRIVIFPIDGLLVICKVVDIKPGYGRDFYKLIPIAGSGEKWTSKVPGKELEYVDAGKSPALSNIIATTAIEGFSIEGFGVVDEKDIKGRKKWTEDY